MQHLLQSPTKDSFVQNPYPFYKLARQSADIIWWDDYALPCATSHATVNALLRDRRFGREVPANSKQPIPDHLVAFYAVEEHSMLELEAPRHPRLRGLVLRAFTTRRITGLAPELETLCHQLIDGFDGQEIDLLSAYCQHIPVVVIRRLLGVPESMAGQLLKWSSVMVGMYQARRTRKMEDAAATASAEFSAFMRSYVDERRTKPADDLITHLIQAEQDGERLNTDELITTCILLLNAGHEATVHTMGNGVKLLLEQQTDRACLSAENIDRTVEEILRYDPPLHLFTRWAYQDVEIAGHTISAGQEVGLLLASANRDGTVWDNPDIFDPLRPQKTNTAFGAGTHFCIGAALARLELKIALRVLFDRLPDLHLVGEPRYANLYHFHGLEALRVAI